MDQHRSMVCFLKVLKEKAALIADCWWNISGRNLGEYLSVLSRSFPFITHKRYVSCSSPSGSAPPTKGPNYQMIPKDILEEIALKLNPVDLEWMSQAFPEWKSILKSQDIRKPPKDIHDLPWLLLPQDPNWDHVTFYRWCNTQVYRIELPRLLQGGRCSGASKGWLVMVTGSPYISFVPFIPHLWNPISGEVISLPSLRTLPNFNSLFAAVLISNYSIHSVLRRVEVISIGSDQLIVAAIFGWSPTQCLGFCRPQGKRWTILDIEAYFYADILFHNGVLYALTLTPSLQGLFSINLGDCELRVVLISLNFKDHLHLHHQDVEPHQGFRIIKRCDAILYLAESTSGELLLVSRVFDMFDTYNTFVEEPKNNAETKPKDLFLYCRTAGFQVEVINFEPGNYLPTFTRLTSLKDEALFVASSGSLSHKSDMDTSCIYFLAEQVYLLQENFPFFSRDSGVFHDGRRELRRSLPGVQLPIQSIIGWFIPNLPEI